MHVIAGDKGEVGSALQTVLSRLSEEVWGFDTDSSVEHRKKTGKAEFLHICFPWSPESFTAAVNQYCEDHLERFGVCVVHSTVPVGTCSRIGSFVVHSPVRGQHPDLAKSIRTFVKYFGGARAGEAAGPFRELGIKCVMSPRPENTEALKLWSTTQYGVSIIVEKAIHEFCEREGLDFELIYRHANQTYNEGYFELDKGKFRRPILDHVPGPIGGHCVVENAGLLDDDIGLLIRQKQLLYQSIELDIKDSVSC